MLKESLEEQIKRARERAEMLALQKEQEIAENLTSEEDEAPVKETQKMPEAEAPVEEAQKVPEAEAPVGKTCPMIQEKPAELKKKQKKESAKYCVTARLTEAERDMFQTRVKDAGLTQSDFVKKALLYPTVVVEELGIGDVAVLEGIAMIRAELRQVNAQLKILVTASAEQKALHLEEWDYMIGIILELEAVRIRLSDLERRLLYGTH